MRNTIARVDADGNVRQPLRAFFTASTNALALLVMAVQSFFASASFDTSADPNVSYFYWIEVRKPDGTSLWSEPAAVAARVTFAAPPYPNPSRRATTIEYRIASDVAGSGAVPVSITVHDLQGRRVRTLRSANQPAGDYRVEWDHRDERGATVGGGIYYVLFRAGALTQNARIAVVR